MPLFGAHMSIAVGYERALIAARNHGCDTVQLFTKSLSQGARRFGRLSPNRQRSAIPNTDDDINPKILLQKRKSKATFLELPDTVTMVVGYPDGGRNVLSSGSILGGSIADSLMSGGRKKSNTYHFVFGSFDGFQGFQQFVANVFQTAALLR